MSKPLDELYLSWLYSQVGSVKLKAPSKTYWTLIRQLYTKEFVWLIPNDDNRVEDGRDLRYEFIDSEGIGDVDPDWMTIGCSMLEMLIGLSRRLSFEVEGEPRTWFWHMIETLEIFCTDNDYDKKHYRKVDETLNQVIWRTYSPDGSGGLFPLTDTTQDQREVELWYQLSAYLLELI